MLQGTILLGAHPNVLVIITDEHNFRTLGCYRDQLPANQAEMWGPGAVVSTPNIDRLAHEGVLCTRAYATSPVCSPCRAAMVTGYYPHNVGVPTNNHILDRSIPTLADLLNARGYRSGFIGKWHLGGEGKPEWAPKVDGGFQFKKYMFNRGHWKKFGEQDGTPFIAAKNKQGAPSYAVAGADEKSFATDFLTDRAIEFVHASDDPFLLFVSYPDPHGPNTVRPPYDHRFDELRFLAPRTYESGVEAPNWLGTTKKHPKFRGEDMSRYFGMVQCLDDNLGRLFETLRTSEKLDDTLVVITSDHGDLCYEHDRLNKGNPYEGSARVPMIFRFPASLPQGKVFTQPMGTVDLTPTILGLLPDSTATGKQIQHQGRDLAHQLAENTSNPDPKEQVTFLRNSGTSARWVAAIDSDYKLIVSVNDQPWLFDRKQDADELLNFYGRPGMQEITLRLAEQLVEYGKNYSDPYVTEGKIAESIREILN